MIANNMYGDSVRQWNVFGGCIYGCVYCIKSFQAQNKRLKHKCLDCYNYIPHFHEERLSQSLPRTEGDEFIFACASGDITWAEPEWVNAILSRIRELPDRTFLLQTKDPSCFNKYKFPENVLLDITLETNRDENYREISKAPLPSKRFNDYLDVEHTNKLVTIEPILDFDTEVFIEMLKEIHPLRVYIGYDSKNCKLSEPEIIKTKDLAQRLSAFTRVKRKLLRKAWWE